MKLFIKCLIVWIATVLLSCNVNVIPGKYFYKRNSSFIEIDKYDNYNFSATGGVHQPYMFSRGKIKLHHDTIIFLPDSSFFFHIAVVKYSFDSSLRGKRKIIIHGTDKFLTDYRFCFDDHVDTIYDFNKKDTLIYRPNVSPRRDSFSLIAKLTDSVIEFPRPAMSSLTSNTIKFSDVNYDDPQDKPWNVLELKVIINRNMFSFTNLSGYGYRKHKIIKLDWPTYVLSN